MSLKKRFVYHIFHEGKIIGMTKSRKSAKRICKLWFPNRCDIKLTRVM